MNHINDNTIKCITPESMASIISVFARTGVTFKAVEYEAINSPNYFIITMTGGY